MWMGAKNFYDPVLKTTLGVKVIGAGPRLPENQLNMTFSQSIQLIAREQPPLVIVDDQIGTNNTLYDSPDELDEVHHDQLSIGMYGRSKRQADFESLEIVHVETPD